MSKFQRTQYISFIATLAFVLLPVFVHAEAIPIPGLNEIIQMAIDTIRSVAGGISALTLIFFGIRYLTESSNANRKIQLVEVGIVLIVANILIYGGDVIVNALLAPLKK